MIKGIWEVLLSDFNKAASVIPSISSIIISHNMISVWLLDRISIALEELFIGNTLKSEDKRSHIYQSISGSSSITVTVGRSSIYLYFIGGKTNSGIRELLIVTIALSFSILVTCNGGKSTVKVVVSPGMLRALIFPERSFTIPAVMANPKPFRFHPFCFP